MSDRWKYALKMGLLWMLVLPIFNILYDLNEISFFTQITNPQLYLRMLLYFIIGTFIIGYFDWGLKNKKTK
jgi:uncharacterized membrane protein YczE